MVPRSDTQKAIQLELRLRTWGGKRDGAGRPKQKRSGVSHGPRASFGKTTPVHVTLKMLPHVYNLRSARSFSVVARALTAAADRFGVRMVRFSVQADHLHLLIEASNPRDLSVAIKGLCVRVAKGLNKMMGRSGRIFADRYHAHLLRTPTEVRRVIEYIARNARKHALRRDEKFRPGWVDPYSSGSMKLGFALPQPETWLVKEGWKRARPARQGSEGTRHERPLRR